VGQGPANHVVRSPDSAWLAWAVQRVPSHAGAEYGYRGYSTQTILIWPPCARLRCPAESSALGFTHLQFEALLTAARKSPNPYDLALVAMLGLLGLRIFETTGAWEDYSTPARDFRLLIAIDVVRGFPDRVVRRAVRYAMPSDRSIEVVKGELQGVLASELASRKISYTRSDGSQWTLSLKEVVDRATQFEMAYNPNDCVEVRWGAPENSEEASTCKRHAPQAQRAKMSSDYRGWFRERHWPTAKG